MLLSRSCSPREPRTQSRELDCKGSYHRPLAAEGDEEEAAATAVSLLCCCGCCSCCSCWRVSESEEVKYISDPLADAVAAGQEDEVKEELDKLEERQQLEQKRDMLQKLIHQCITHGEVNCLQAFCAMVPDFIQHEHILSALTEGIYNSEITVPVLEAMSSEKRKLDGKQHLLYSGDVRTVTWNTRDLRSQKSAEADWDVKEVERHVKTLVKDGEFMKDLYSVFEQHFLDPSEAACDVYVLRPALRCDRQTLTALAKVPAQSCWQTVAAKAVITHAWRKAFPIFVLDVGVCGAMLWLLMWLTHKVHQHQFPPLTVLGLCVGTAYDAVHMLAKIWADARVERQQQHHHQQQQRVSFPSISWALLVRRASRLTLLIFELSACTMVSNRHRRGDQHRLTLAAWVACRWLRFGWCLRGTRLVGERVLPVVYALGDIAGFLFVCLFTLAAAIHMFYVLGDSGDLDVLYFDFDVVYRLVVLQDFDLDELQNSNPSLKLGIMVFFYSMTASLSIILMNLLIGVLGANYDRFADRGEELFMRGRASILSGYLACPWWRWVISLEGDTQEAKDGLIEIVVAMKPLDTKVEEDRSFRTVLEKQMGKIMREIAHVNYRLDWADHRGRNREMQDEIKRISKVLSKVVRQQAEILSLHGRLANLRDEDDAEDGGESSPMNYVRSMTSPPSSPHIGQGAVL